MSEITAKAIICVFGIIVAQFCYEALTDQGWAEAVEHSWFMASGVVCLWLGLRPERERQAA